MSVPFHSEKVELALYDSFVKKCLRNRSRSIDKSGKRRMKHEVVGIETVMFYCDALIYEDNYPSDSGKLQVNDESYVFTCVVMNTILFDAMKLLDERHREVLILDYWYKWTDKQIAHQLHINESTVRAWRKKSLHFIREYFKRN